MSEKILHRGDGCSFAGEVFANKACVNTEEFANLTGKGQTIVFVNPPKIIGRYAVGGSKESKGPMGKYLHRTYSDDKMGEKIFERAEINMFKDAIKGAIESANVAADDIDLMVAGDLLNQITTSGYVARDFGIPFTGLYSACSTMSECLAVAATFLSAGHFEKVLCATASHFATAERQYRYPLEYGCQRPPYAQWTVTGAGACVLSRVGSGPKIVSATIGKVIDYGTNDLNNMGASMAPAAMDSMCSLFSDTGTGPDDYDMIVTGDLGKLGSDILRELMYSRGYFLGSNYIDCGSLIYDVTQKCYQGGSGAGCSASVVNSFVLDKLESGECSSVAYFATGALMSSQSCYQGESIPCISHGVVIKR